MELTNLLNLCRFHHSLQHSLGWDRFVEQYPVIRHELKIRGWEIHDEFGIKRLRRI